MLDGCVGYGVLVFTCVNVRFLVFQIQMSRIRGFLLSTPPLSDWWPQITPLSHSVFFPFHPPPSLSVFAIVLCGCLPGDNFILTAYVALCQWCWCMRVGEAADRHGQQGNRSTRADLWCKRGYVCVCVCLCVCVCVCVCVCGCMHVYVWW